MDEVLRGVRARACRLGDYALQLLTCDVDHLHPYLQTGLKIVTVHKYGKFYEMRHNLPTIAAGYCVVVRNRRLQQ